MVEIYDLEDGGVTTHSTVNPYPVSYGASAGVPGSGIYVWVVHIIMRMKMALAIFMKQIGCTDLILMLQPKRSSGPG